MTVTKQLIDNVNKIKTTLNEISVYNLDVKTAIELYYELAKKVNEVINELSRFEGVVSDEVIKQNEKLIYLLGEGLKVQVGLKIDELIKDGTIQDLINNKIFNELNTKIDNFKQEVNDQFNTIKSEIVNINKKDNDLLNSIIFSNKNIEKKFNFWGYKTINIIGDSITHGANADNFVDNSYAGIIRKALNNKYSTGQNYGFEKLYSGISDSMVGFHKLATNGFYLSLDNDNISLSSYKSTTSGNTLTITPSKSFNNVMIVYQGKNDGGTFTIKTNEQKSVPIFTINTNVTSNYNMPYFSNPFPVKKGDSIIIENITNKQVEILGVLYLEDTSKHVVCNYARNGAFLTDISDDVLNMYAQCGLCIFSLGHNDHFDNSRLTTFKQKINTLIDLFKTNNTFVVVNDFCWTVDQSNEFREELKRLAEALNGIYIPYHDLLGYGNTSQEWISKGFLADSSHPSNQGHKTIANILSYYLNLPLVNNKFKSELVSCYSLVDGLSITQNSLSFDGNSVRGCIRLEGKGKNLVTGSKLCKILVNPTKWIVNTSFLTCKISSQKITKPLELSISDAGEIYYYNNDILDSEENATLTVNIDYPIV